MKEDEYITIRTLKLLLDRKAKQYGDDSYVALDGFDPCKIEVIDNHDPELYEGVSTLISG